MLFSEAHDPPLLEDMDSDDTDSKMESMRAHFEREPESEWTSYNASLERPLLNTRKFLEHLYAVEPRERCIGGTRRGRETLE